MADLSLNDSSQKVSIVGSDSSGSETNPIASNTAGELSVNDTPNQAGVENAITLTTTAIIAKVGVSPLDNRKYVVIQALDNNVKWGFSSTCRFDCFKNQLIFIPAGPDAVIYLKASTGTAIVVLGEE